MYSGLEVAKFIITKTNKEHKPISCLNLNMTLYLCQIEYYLKNNTFLIYDDFVVGKMSPIIKSVYEKYKHNYSGRIINIYDNIDIKEDDKKFIDSLVEKWSYKPIGLLTNIICCKESIWYKYKKKYDDERCFFKKIDLVLSKQEIVDDKRILEICKKNKKEEDKRSKDIICVIRFVEENVDDIINNKYFELNISITIDSESMIGEIDYENTKIKVNKGDYIIKYANGDIHVCREKDFSKVIFEKNKKNEWIYIGDNDWKCAKCGFVITLLDDCVPYDYEDFNYCGCCGNKMFE